MPLGELCILVGKNHPKYRVESSGDWHIESKQKEKEQGHTCKGDFTSNKQFVLLVHWPNPHYARSQHHLYIEPCRGCFDFKKKLLISLHSISFSPPDLIAAHS
jgi:hypothetical protein